MLHELAQLQQDFVQGVLDHDEQAPILSAIKTVGINLQSEQRLHNLALYRGNLTQHWRDSLVNAYPVLKQLVGAAFFDDLAVAYGRQYPSLSGNLTHFGEQVADFITSLSSCAAYPYLVDVARLEWLVHQSYFLAQHTPIDLNTLAQFAPEELGNLHFDLQPSCFLLQSTWAVVDIWQAHQAEDKSDLNNDLQQAQCALIWRNSYNRWRVNVSVISSAEYAALTALKNKATLGDAINEALQVAAMDDVPFDFQNSLASWMAQQIFYHTTI